MQMRIKISAHCVLEHSAQVTVWTFIIERIQENVPSNVNSVKNVLRIHQRCMCIRDCIRMKILISVICVVEEQSKPAICDHITNTFTKTMT